MTSIQSNVDALHLPREMYMSAQCTSYMDRGASRVHGVHAVSVKAPFGYGEYAKSIKSTDKGLFTKSKCTLVSNAILVSGCQAM